MRHLGRLIAERCDSGRLVRGHELFDDGMVDHLHLQGTTVTAEVYGSRSDAYEVEIRLRDGPLPAAASAVRFACTCPDWGDPCKHGVAVLLAYAERLDDGGLPDEPPLNPAAGTARASREPRPAARVPLAARPAWADDLEEPTPPRTLQEWLGGATAASGTSLATFRADVDPIDLLLELGPCEISPGGPDLAPAIQLLLLRLRGG